MPKFGYPDMGNGWYSTKLSYKQWYEFSLVQRVHYNFLESCIIICFLILVAGIRHPGYTVIAGITYSVARLINAYGYSKSAKGRVPGFVFGMILQFTLFGLSVHSVLGMIN